MAKAKGFEPLLKALETLVLPLHHANKTSNHTMKIFLAVRIGFEPMDRISATFSLAKRRFSPLSHLTVMSKNNVKTKSPEVFESSRLMCLRKYLVV